MNAIEMKNECPLDPVTQGSVRSEIKEIKVIKSIRGMKNRCRRGRLVARGSVRQKLRK